MRELAAGLRRLGKTDGVACTAQHVQVHLLHRLQVNKVELVSVESMRRGASGSASPSALAARRLSLNKPIWTDGYLGGVSPGARTGQVQVCTAAPVFVQSFVYDFYFSSFYFGQSLQG